ncbi:MAG: methionine ABC transporter substrate-binding protein [Spirochaetaceae bacterium]|jgi:D-methionine transport system substrate-binding protein|nr:methionine ABC transporter substrate-binding protein [Spirochaetaceae bacterium]
MKRVVGFSWADKHEALKRVPRALEMIMVMMVFITASCERNKNEQNKSASPETSATVEVAGAALERTKLVVVADLVPHTELLEFVSPKLAVQGIDLEIVTVIDGTTSNEKTSVGEFDANFFQHEPYLKSVVAEQGYDVVNAGNIHVEPIGAYSEVHRTKEELPDNATIAIPNDATNEFRALTILAENGFIRLKEDMDVYSTTTLDVAEYIKPITLVELDSAAIIRVRDQFDAYITNTNKVLEAGIDTGTVLFREGKDSPYANILGVKSSRVNDPAIKALYQALTSEDVRQFIEEKYKGAVIPAF